MESLNRLCRVCQTKFIRRYSFQKYCSKKCGQWVAFKRWSRKNKRNLRKRFSLWYEKNKDKNNKQSKEYYQKNKIRLRKYANKIRRELRSFVIKKYGGKCKCCGESELAFLAIDHVNNDGYKEKKKIKNNMLLSRLRDRKINKKYQVLCHNCNSAKGYYGCCPHDKSNN